MKQARLGRLDIARRGGQASTRVPSLSRGLLAGGRWPAVGKRGGEPGSRADPEFAVRARQVVFHGSLSHEQGLRDLSVRLPGCGELRCT